MSSQESFNLQLAIQRYGRVLPLLSELKATEQDPEWHAEGNVAIHTSRVIEQACREARENELSEKELQILSHAAAFHDIAKPLTTRHAEKGGRMRVVSPRHAQIGRSYLAIRAVDLLNAGGLNEAFDVEMFQQVIALVGHHHDLRKLVAAGKSLAPHEIRGKYVQLARLCDIRLLYHLCRADMLGREAGDIEGQLETIEMFRLQAEEFGLWDGGGKQFYAEWKEEIWHLFCASEARSEAFCEHAFAMAKREFEVGKIHSVHEAIAKAWNLPKDTYKLHILCGVSGSGKSTWIEKFSANDSSHVEVVSLDLLRAEITGKREDQSMNGQVMQAAKEKLKQGLRAHKDVIFDATNLRVDGRSWVVQLARDYGAFSAITAFAPGVTELRKRNRKRENSIKFSVLERQIERFEWPLADEADSVEYLID